MTGQRWTLLVQGSSIVGIVGRARVWLSNPRMDAREIEVMPVSEHEETVERLKESHLREVEHQREEARKDWAERDEAFREVGRLREALGELIRLKDGPRDELYYAQKAGAWQRAREAFEAASS